MKLLAFFVAALWFVEPAYVALYNELDRLFPGSAYLIGSNFITTAVYWVAVIPFSILDWYPTEWSMSIRIQNPIDMNRPHDVEAAQNMSPARNARRRQLFWTAVWQSARNQAVGMVFGALLIWAGAQPRVGAAGWALPLYIAASIVVTDGLFYYLHRLMHTRPLYPIHKQHHQYVSPFAAAAIACHPIEHIICNVFPVMMAPVIVEMPAAATWIWYTIAILNVTVFSHSGYNLPGIPTSGEAHDWHHLYMDEYFGASGLFDWLHGTDRRFRASIQGRRVAVTTREEFQQITFS